MNEWETLVYLVGVPLALRVVDAILPAGHHLRIISRWLEKTKEGNDDETA